VAFVFVVVVVVVCLVLASTFAMVTAAWQALAFAAVAVCNDVMARSHVPAA
jgi:hypothetical protein